jgi:branched-chain amino acid transport system permease protein
LGASIEYLLMAVLGGVGHLYGAIVGSLLVVGLKNTIQDALPSFIGPGGSYEGLIFGILLVAVLHQAKSGLWPRLAVLVPVAARPLPQPVESGQSGERKWVSVDPALSAVNLTKAFGGLTAVDRVSFDIRPGEIVGLIGPNGAGKSTTFDMLSGVQRVTAGQIRHRDALIQELRSDRIASRGIGRTFQHVRLTPDMSVLDNVALGAHLRGSNSLARTLLGLNKAEERLLLGIAMRQLERVGLQADARRPAGELALGKQRLVEVARALCMDLDVLMLDEPAAGLRHAEKAALKALLASLRREGVTIILVEHDMEFVMTLADRLVVLNFGTKISEGAPEAVRSDAKVLEAYLGTG